ncbi:MAG: hypothetical protein J3Q66DRAFT_389258 [Benniella sp.]|nr:MAG: hypothetical protein J3Q66DRAFT_389258 [Benniella sp.]
MSTATSQAFRAQASSKIISIPTRYDGKSNQRVIRWTDIQRCFKNAHYVMHGEDVVLSLTDGDLEDLIPLRIAHHPGVVLAVVITDDSHDMNDRQNDWSQSSDAGNNQALVDMLRQDCAYQAQVQVIFGRGRGTMLRGKTI